MTFGVILFGQSSKSFALNSFSVHDPIANIARLAFGSSVLASFPLIFLSIRTWFMSQMSKVMPSWSNTTSAAVMMLALIGCLASKVTDIGIFDNFTQYFSISLHVDG